MRHRVKGKKLGRNINQRQALFKSLIQALILHEKIATTEAKAKVISRMVDKLVTKAKTGSLSARRQVLAFLPDKKAVHKLFEVIAPRTQDRTSGFTRFVRLNQRRGDNTQMASIEFVDKPVAVSSSSAKNSDSTKSLKKPKTLKTILKTTKDKNK